MPEGTEGAAAPQQQQAPIVEGDTRVEAIVAKRVNEKNAQITRLETELAGLRPKAQGYDAVNTQLIDATSKLQQEQASNGYLRAAAPHGFQPQVIDHLSKTYADSMASVPQPSRTPFGDWLNAAMANPAGTDPVTSAVLEKHLASRAGQGTSQSAASAAATQTAPVQATTTQATQQQAAGQTQQAATVQAPNTNNGVKPNPQTQAGYTEIEIREIMKDRPRFEQWRKDNPVLWAQLKTRGWG